MLHLRYGVETGYMEKSNYYEKYWNDPQSDNDRHVADIPKWPVEELKIFYLNIKRFIGEDILDIGAGEGIFANFLKDNHKSIRSIEALEISENAIKRGKEKNPWLKYTQGSADAKLPYKEEQFDTIIMTDVIEHLLDVDMTLSECYRILEPGGKLILITPDFNLLKKMIISIFFWEKFFYPDNPHVRFFTRKSMKNIMKKHNFKEVFYKWGLTWYGLMPQNMYTAYEKSKFTIGSCLANPNGWRSPGTFGGGEKITKDTFEDLKEYNFEIVQTENGIFKKKDNINISELRLPIGRTTHPLLDVTDFIFWFFLSSIKLIEKRKIIDLVYAPTTNAADFLPCFFVAKLFNKKLIAKCQITIYEGNGNSYFNIYSNYRHENNSLTDSCIRSVSAYVTLVLLRRCDVIICLTDGVKKSLLNKDIPHEKFKVNYHGININKMSMYTYNEKIYDLCFMSRIEEYKGIFDFIAICKEYQKINPLFRAIIIGDGSCFSSVKNKIKELELNDNIEVLGFMAEKRFIYLGKSSLLIFPTIAKEGLGLVIAEAIACGTPVVTYKNRIFEEVFGSLNSVILCENYNELKKSTFNILSDKDKINLLFKKAQLEALKFDLKETILRESSIIRSLV